MLTSSFGRIHGSEMPDSQTMGLELGGVRRVGEIGLVEGVALYDQQVAVIVQVVARQPGLAFDGRPGNRDLRT